MIVACRNVFSDEGALVSVELRSRGLDGVLIDVASSQGEVDTGSSDSVRATSSNTGRPVRSDSRSDISNRSEESHAKASLRSGTPGASPVAAFIDRAVALRDSSDPDRTLDAWVCLPPDYDAERSRITLALRGRNEPVAELDGTNDPGLSSRVEALAATIESGRVPVPELPADPHPIETDRLRITFPTEPQLDDYFAAIHGTDVFDTLLWDGPESPVDLYEHAFLMRQHAARNPLGFYGRSVVARDKSADAGRVVGGVSWRPFLEEPKRGDIGYAFAPYAHGRGYATEAVRAVVDHAFESCGAEQIEALVFAGNDRSARVVQKCAFELAGTLTASIVKRGRELDQWQYVLTRARWRTNRTQSISDHSN